MQIKALSTGKVCLRHQTLVPTSTGQSSLLKQSPRNRILLLAIGLLFFIAPVANAQRRDAFRIDYTVSIASLESHLFHVTADIKNIKESRVELSLPTWTPGWYTVENYFKNVLRFKITDAKGKWLQPEMIHKQTWRVETKGLDSIKVEFDYRANVLALNQAKITSDFAFFTGIELFVMAAGHRGSPSSVRFELPNGWKIISALTETRDPMTFTAPDYDTLVDAPTEMGKFDVNQFQVEGKPHYLLTTPAGALAKDRADKFAAMLAKVAAAQSSIFGGLPYDKYVYFYFFSRAESNAGGALEHLNSHVAFAFSPNPEFMIDTASHEFFHTWNVKRIRPAEMWPYDYARENETPLLWVSEGFTNYYGNVALYRTGLRNRKQFLQSVEGAIRGVESNEARSYISPANSSVSTWVGYDTPVAFGISYYTQGQNLGALLDLSILQDTGGAAGLDDVMRTLYLDFYKRDKGFTTEDLIAILNRLTRRDYRDFHRKYVSGVEVPPYDTILGYAGYKLESAPGNAPAIGIEYDETPEGVKIRGVNANGAAAKAGLRAGDILVSLDGLDLQKDRQAIDEKLQRSIDRKVKLQIKRGGQAQTVDLQVGSRSDPSYKIVELPNPTARQLKIREAWLKAGR
jgi:predicted metalloprotease with PDZ domain